MEIYQKIENCRQAIRETKTEKKGYNDFSKYSYFLPEQINNLVSDACKEEKLFVKYDLDKNDFGIFATLTVINLDVPSEQLIFKMITDIPVIKATNIAQQLGGTVTYSERYLKMTTFGIVEDSMDLDTQQKTAKKSTKKDDSEDDNKKWLNKYLDKEHTKEDPKYWKIINGAKEKNLKLKDLRKYYKISKPVEKELEQDL